MTIGALSPTHSLMVLMAIKDNNLDVEDFIITKNDVSIAHSENTFTYFQFRDFDTYQFIITDKHDGSFDVQMEPIEPTYGHSLVNGIYFKNKRHQSISVIELFDSWLHVMSEEKKAIIVLQSIRQTENAKNLLKDGFQYLDNEQAVNIIELQEKVTELAELVELLLSKSVEHFEWRNNVYTKEEIHSKIEELNKEIDSKSKKFEVKKMFLTAAFTELIKHGLNPDNITKLIG